MLTSTISGDGKTTVPAEVRKALNAPPGTLLAWTVNGGSAEVCPQTRVHQSKRGQCDYEALLKNLQESPAVPDHLLTIRRSIES